MIPNTVLYPCCYWPNLGIECHQLQTNLTRWAKMSNPISEDPVTLVQNLASEAGSAVGNTPKRGGFNASVITSRLRDAIETGLYGLGDQLPPERELAESFGAGRSTVRRALDQLERAGLVSRKVGSGTFVTWNGGFDRLDNISDRVSPLQLVETRFAIEPYMAELAVLHATRKDLETMQALLDRLDTLAFDKDGFSKWDAEFHLSLAQASRNPLIVFIYRQINEVRLHAQWNAQKEKILHPQRIATYNRQHREIFAALCERDAETVQRLIREHLELARNDLIHNQSN